MHRVADGISPITHQWNLSQREEPGATVRSMIHGSISHTLLSCFVRDRRIGSERGLSSVVAGITRI